MVPPTAAVQRSSDSSMDILFNQDALSLMKNGLAGPTTSTGTRKIHRRRLNRSSEEDSAEIPLHTNPQARPDAFVTIPQELISKATIEWCGFKSAKAAHTWQRWTEYSSFKSQNPPPAGYDYSFLEFIQRSVDNTKDAWDDNNSQWISCMEYWGITQQLQVDILDDRFKSIRLSRTCVDWLKEIIGWRYSGLEDIRDASRERASALQHGGSRTGRSGSDSTGGSFFGAPGSSGSAGPSRSGGRPRGLSEGQPGGQAALQPFVTASDLAAERAPGFTVLYRATLSKRIENILLAPDNTLSDLTCLASLEGPSDFHRTKSMYYFGTSIELAEEYAGWIKKTAGDSNRITIVSLRIPNRAIETLSSTQLARAYFPSDEWKKIVWYSRRGKKPPTELSHFSAALLFIGSTSRRNNEYFRKLDSWQKIVAADLVPMRSGANPIQYAFTTDNDSGPCGEDFLKAHAENVATRAYTKKQYLSWLETH